MTRMSVHQCNTGSAKRTLLGGGGDSAGARMPTNPPQRAPRPTISCQRYRPKESMGTKGARWSPPLCILLVCCAICHFILTNDLGCFNHAYWSHGHPANGSY